MGGDSKIRVLALGSPYCGLYMMVSMLGSVYLYLWKLAYRA